MPGDFKTPNAVLAPGAATHGPGSLEQPVELVATARPPVGAGGVIPLLYIYGPNGEYVSGTHAYEKLLTNSAFAQVEKEAYWGEVADNHYYLVPWLDKCAQAAMLETPAAFRAPTGGIMFMQYLAPSCEECTQLTQAIETFIAQNRQMPVRWVRVSVPRSVGELRQ